MILYTFTWNHKCYGTTNWLEFAKFSGFLAALGADDQGRTIFKNAEKEYPTITRLA